MKQTQLDPLSPPEERSSEPGYLAGWADCAKVARTHLAERVSDLLGSLVSVKDARIRELERDNALLKTQIEELETFLR